MSKDKVGVSDNINAGVVKDSVSPKYPCPKCHKESKEHNKFHQGIDGLELIPGSRICSDRMCREEFNIYDTVLLN